MRRRGELLAEVGGVPTWLRVFEPERWVPHVGPPPAGWVFGLPRWQEISAHQQWREAGLSWLDDRGQRRAWWSLTRTRAVGR